MDTSKLNVAQLQDLLESLQLQKKRLDGEIARTEYELQQKKSQATTSVSV